ncbi:hypothetical protein LWF15_17210 [Kineosporia rhizophila]|uniref:hypothetical protein n=1 Tax=Kineosporia rhizophila TaxID=84633 RepID=UPI000A8A0974|nr:hypothetical protein [Kineosporia rhizophila]MCE0537243.1 hypothetical protein [Kineosporia rhizophila]
MEEPKVWYASYGSNLHAERFTVYLLGGTPPGGRRATSGCRDKRLPFAVRPFEVPGGIFFATESLVWGGGRAFYDAKLPGSTAMRAYLITLSQFSDVVAQEMYSGVRADVDLREVLTQGRSQLGPGRYETLVRLRGPQGPPTITFTSPWNAGDVPALAPSAAYLRVLGLGVKQAHGWPVPQVARYLAAAPGAAGAWSADEIAALLA